MSGGKGLSLLIVPAVVVAAPIAVVGAAVVAVGGAVVRRERLKQQQRRRLEERAQSLAGQLNTVAERWRSAAREHGERFPEWSYGDVARDLAECAEDSRHGNSALAARLENLAERVARARRTYAQQSAISRMQASLQVTLESPAAESGNGGRAVEDDEAQDDERDLRRCVEEATRLIEGLEAEASSEARMVVEERVGTIGTSSASRRQALLTQLRYDIQRANKAASERRRMVAQAEQWRERLLGLEGPEVEALDLELRRAVEGETATAADMAQRVHDVVARATEAANRSYAVDVITEELGNLGYVVESGFDTASAQASDMLLHKADMEDDYHVSLRAEAGASTLQTRVVREARDGGSGAPGSRSAERERTDLEMEQGWCQDLAVALAAAQKRGVVGRVVSRKAAGEEPVSTIAPLEGRSKASNKRRGKRRKKRASRLKSRVAR